MPKTLMAMRRIQRMHDEGNHERCDSRKCAVAAKEFDEIQTAPGDNYQRLCGLRAKALFDECEKNPSLNFYDYVDDVPEAMSDIEALDGEEPDLVQRIQARAEIKLTVHNASSH